MSQNNSVVTDVVEQSALWPHYIQVCFCQVLPSFNCTHYHLGQWSKKFYSIQGFWPIVINIYEWYLMHMCYFSWLYWNCSPKRYTMKGILSVESRPYFMCRNNWCILLSVFFFLWWFVAMFYPSWYCQVYARLLWFFRQR